MVAAGAVLGDLRCLALEREEAASELRAWSGSTVVESNLLWGLEKDGVRERVIFVGKVLSEEVVCRRRRERVEMSKRSKEEADEEIKPAMD